MIIKLKEEEMKREVMRSIGKLKGKDIWIEKDQTFKERKMRWKLKNMAEEERRKGKRVRQGYGRIWIEDSWWYWDEEEEALRDVRGKKRGERMVEEREERKGQ